VFRDVDRTTFGDVSAVINLFTHKHLSTLICEDKNKCNGSLGKEVAENKRLKQSKILFEEGGLVC